MRAALALGIGCLPFLASAQTRPHPYDLLHVKWHVGLDEAKMSVTGDVTNVIRARRGVPEVWFDRGELSIHRVTVNDRTAAHRTAGDRVFVTLPSSLRDGRTLSVRVRYSGTPRAGLYFVPGKRAYPAKTSSIYTQGEMEDTRHWLVTYDYPDDKATSEGIIDVPRGYFALSNGRLLSRRDIGSKTRFHWKMEQPHVTYLISIVAGPYEKGHETWAGIPVDYYIPKGLLAWGKASFGGTNRMVQFFSELTGFKYPYAKFSQAVVPDFMFGGMENITAVTNTLNALHPAAVHPVANAEGLNLHELAHQWFGDTVTTNGWSDIWINEGWASFLPAFYVRKVHGQEVFDLARYDTFNGGLDAHRQMPDRAVVWRGYKAPLDIFTGHVYAGGASRMFMLMDMLGEEAFWRATSRYLNERKFTSFDTKAFFSTWSRLAGRDLTSFMNQWFYRPAAPKLTVRWNGGDVVISQPEPYFDLDLDLWIASGNGWEKRRVAVRGAETRVSAPEASGGLVLLDPEVWLMGEIRLDMPLSNAQKLELYQAAPNAAGKARIMDMLLRELPPAEALAFARTIRSKQLLGRYLSAIRPAAGAEEFLLALTRDPDRVLANTAVDRLGSVGLNTPEVRARLREIWRSDPNPQIQVTAFNSLLNLTDDVALAQQGFRTESYRDQVRARALDWLAANKPEMARPRALQAIRSQFPEPTRVSAIGHLGRLKDEQGKRIVFETLMRLVDEPSFGARNTAMAALGDYGDKAAIPKLRTLLNHPLVFFRNTARNAIQRLGG